MSSVQQYLISIIIPVYNCESTINRLLDSIINQSFESFEIIIVNDGSNDTSYSICKEYADKFDFIRIFNSNHGGVALARELGIKNALGKYIIHADGDDWIEPGMLSSMYDAIIKEDADILIADFIVDSDSQRIYKSQKFERKSSTDLFYDIISGKLMGSLWNKLIKRELYIDNVQYFYSGINYLEDVLSLAKLMLSNDLKIVHLNKAFYHYVVNAGSITNNVSKHTYEGLIRYKETISAILPKEERFNKYIEEFTITLFELGFTHDFIDADQLGNEYLTIQLNIAKHRRGRRYFAHRLYQLGLKKIAKKVLKFRN